MINSQIHKLEELQKEAKYTHNYTEVYKFIQDQLPDDKDKAPDQKALDIWLDVAISTNNNSSDIVDVGLRNTTKKTLKRTLGSDYKKHYGNEAKFYEQYKKISNETAEKIANDLAHGYKIDTDYIVNLDAYNFQKFDTDFKSEKGINSGRVKVGDWQGSTLDKDLFGKDYIQRD